MNRNAFTLIEILFAIVILTMALGVTLSISGQAKSDFSRAQNRWLSQHSLEQAIEFFLLTSPDDLSIPDDFLPPGFQATCTISPVEEGLPDFANAKNYKGWTLGAYAIEVSKDGIVKATQTIYKLIPEDDAL